MDKDAWEQLKKDLDELVGKDLPYDLRGGNGDMKGAENCSTFVIFVVRRASREEHPNLPKNSKQGGYSTPKGLGEALKEEAKKENAKVKYKGKLVDAGRHSPHEPVPVPPDRVRAEQYAILARRVA